MKMCRMARDCIFVALHRVCTALVAKCLQKLPCAVVAGVAPLTWCAKIIRALMLSQKWIQIKIAPSQPRRRRRDTISSEAVDSEWVLSWVNEKPSRERIYEILYGVENWLSTLFAFWVWLYNFSGGVCMCMAHKCNNTLLSTSRINNTNKSAKMCTMTHTHTQLQCNAIENICSQHEQPDVKRYIMSQTLNMKWMQAHIAETKPRLLLAKGGWKKEEKTRLARRGQWATKKSASILWFRVAGTQSIERAPHAHSKCEGVMVNSVIFIMHRTILFNCMHISQKRTPFLFPLNEHTTDAHSFHTLSHSAFSLGPCPFSLTHTAHSDVHMHARPNFYPASERPKQKHIHRVVIVHTIRSATTSAKQQLKI